MHHSTQKVNGRITVDGKEAFAKLGEIVTCNVPEALFTATFANAVGTMLTGKYRLLSPSGDQFPLKAFGLGERSHPRRFDIRRFAFDSLESFMRFARDCDAQWPDRVNRPWTFALSGDLIADDAELLDARRLSREDRKTGDRPAITDRGSRLGILDIDRLEVPEGFDGFNREHLIALARTVPGLETAELVVSTTASHSRTNPRIRVFFLHNEARTLAQNKRIFGGYAKGEASADRLEIDAAVFNPALPIYLRAEVSTVDWPSEIVERYIAHVVAHSRTADERADDFRFVRRDLRAKGFRGTISHADPFEAVRWIHVPAAGNPCFCATEEQLAWVSSKPRRKRSEVQSAITRDRTTEKGFDAIPWESGTYEALKSALLDLADDMARRGHVNGPELLARAENTLDRCRGEALSAGNKPRAVVLEGYKARAARLVEWISETRGTTTDEAGTGYDVLAEEDEEPEPAFLPLQVAETKVAELVSTFIAEESKRLHERQLLVKATVGLGKSRAAKAALIQEVTRNPFFRVAVIAPSHSLAEEWSDDLNQAKPGVAHRYQGIGKDEDRLCALPSGESAIWQKAGGSQLTLCRACPLKPECAYPAQEKPLAVAPIVVFAGPAVFFDSVPEMARERAKNPAFELQEQIPLFDLVILDETNPSNWLSRGKITLEKLGRPIVIQEFHVETRDLEKAALRMERVTEGADVVNAILPEVIERLRQFSGNRDWWQIEALEDGNGNLIARDPLDLWKLITAAETLYTHANHHDAPGINFQNVETGRKADESLRKRLKRKGEIGQQLRAIRDVCLAGINAGSVWTFDMKHDDEDPLSVGPSVGWRYLPEIHRHWKRSGFLVLDATAEPDLMRNTFPRLETATVNAADGDGVRRYFIAGNMSLTALRSKSADGLTDRAKRTRAQVRHMINVVRRDAANFAVIGPKGVVAGQSDMGGDIILAGHGRRGEYLGATYGSLRGLNRLEGADMGFLVGRIVASRADIEGEAGDLARRDIVGADPLADLPKTSIPLFVRSRRDGEEIVERQLVDGLGHPDPIAAALLRSMTYGELLQADGRFRAVRRDAGNPVEIFHATALPVAGLVYDEMLYTGLTVDDFDRENVRGDIVKAWFTGRGGQSLAGWAAIINDGSSKDWIQALKDLRRNDPALSAAMDAIDGIAMAEASWRASIAAEWSNVERPKDVRGVLSQVLQEGFRLEPAAAKKATKAEVERRSEGYGLGFSQKAWRLAWETAVAFS